LSTPPSLLTRSPLFAVFFFGFFLFLLYQMTRLLTPLLSPLLWAAILTLALHPVYQKLSSRLAGWPGTSAVIMTVATLLLIIGPAVTLLIILAAQSAGLYERASAIAQSGKIAELWGHFESSFVSNLLAHPALAGLDIKGMVVKGIGVVSSGLAGQLGSMLKNTLIFLVDIIIMLIAMFFFFRDGKAYYNTIIDLLPFTRKQKDDVTRKFADTFSAVINGVFLIALLQGIMTGIGFFLFRIPFSIFWGFLAALLALIPIGGAALVWVPGAVYLYLTGSTLQGVLLAAWGLVLVSLPDNFLKPLIIGKKAKIPTFILFIALLGGLQAFGILGILFGPVIVSLLAAFVQIYREEYADR
jgi:predicted PurR-regulated permease PerM